MKRVWTELTLRGPVRCDGRRLVLLDQRLLPGEVRWITVHGSVETAAAIRDMAVRGAPAIGITAAFGYALAVLAGEVPERARATLLASRPTAVNLRWALERLAPLPASALLDEAARIHAEDIACCRAMGEVGAALLPDEVTLYTHCNAGALATGGWGTALGVIRSAVEMGKKVRVYAGETRPWLQGARLTAWELAEDGVDVTLVPDVASATVLPACDVVVVGADRVAANGDVANKVGTCGLAIQARHFGRRMMVAFPASTFDPRCPTGASIPIEARGADEVRGYRSEVWAADVPVFNPAFDVTPAALVDHWVTERGDLRPPFEALR
jgi:methylthioribose-1-phosphate isomerase